jgi:hypothetical protein
MIYGLNGYVGELGAAKAKAKQAAVARVAAARNVSSVPLVRSPGKTQSAPRVQHVDRPNGSTRVDLKRARVERSPAAPSGRAPRAARPSRDDRIVGRQYLDLLRGEVRGIRSGVYPSTAPTPPRPAVALTRRQVKKEDRLLRKLPGVRAAAAWRESLTPPPATDPPPSGGGGSGNGSGGGGGGNPPPDTTTPSSATEIPSSNLSTPQAQPDVQTLPTGTVIDPATGEPIAGSLLSNKWVWIGLGAAVGVYWLMGRKKRGR